MHVVHSIADLFTEFTLIHGRQSAERDMASPGYTRCYVRSKSDIINYEVNLQFLLGVLPDWMMSGDIDQA